MMGRTLLWSAYSLLETATIEVGRLSIVWSRELDLSLRVYRKVVNFLPEDSRGRNVVELIIEGKKERHLFSLHLYNP